MHNENGLSEQEKVPRCHMLAPHSAPPHLSWRSGAFNLPEKHSACVCIWLEIICLHRISFQFQSNSTQFTDVKKNFETFLCSCHHPLLAAPRSACGVPRGVAFTPQCIEPKWTHLIDLRLKPNSKSSPSEIKQSVFSIFCFCSNSERLFLTVS